MVTVPVSSMQRRTIALLPGGGEGQFLPGIFASDPPASRVTAWKVYIARSRRII
jgi:hypothetical protein